MKKGVPILKTEVFIVKESYLNGTKNLKDSKI